MTILLPEREKPYLFNDKNKRGKPCRILGFSCSREGLSPVYCLWKMGVLGGESKDAPRVPRHTAHQTGQPFHLGRLLLDVSVRVSLRFQVSAAFDQNFFFPSSGDFAWVLDPGDLQLLGSVFHCGFCRDCTSRLPLKDFSLFSTLTIVCETSDSGFFFLFILIKYHMRVFS